MRYTIINKYLFLLLLLLVANVLYSQENNCGCIDELNNLSKLIENAKSYKHQINNNHKKAEFKEWKEKIKQEISNDNMSEFFCVGYLQKYIGFINDRHNEVYATPENISASVPTYSKTINTLETNKDDVSGIYYAGSDQILLKKETENTWYGITLKSNSKDWIKGKIRLKINKTATNRFEIFEYYKNGLLFYQKNIEITDGRIHSTFWNKANKYNFNLNHKENFTYKSINSNFDYIGIKTLSRTNALIKEAKNFYAKTLNKLKNENLIIDLRNNGGGSIKQAKTLIKTIQRNKYIKNIYLIINFKTASAAELLTLELKKDKRVKLVGENSRGMLEYGYGNQAFSTKTDCLGLNITLSTKLTNSKYRSYEYVGIKPDYYLHNKSDWLEQIINYEK